MKVLTYNIHKGFSTSNLNFILHGIKDSIQRINADIVLLQEIQGERLISKNRFDDWHNNSQFEFLADEVWPHHAYGKNAIYKSGHHGNAILSKHPFIEWENIDIADMHFASRSLLHGTILDPETTNKIHIICVHMGLFENERRRQFKVLTHRINEHVPMDEALIIAGDFNDWRSRAEKYLRDELNLNEVFKHTHGAYARTFPSWLPVLPMDRIFYRGLDVIDCKTLHGRPWNRLSDHIPLMADLKFV